MTLSNKDDVIWTEDSLSQALGSRSPAGTRSIDITHVETRARSCSPGALFVPAHDPYFPVETTPDSEVELKAICDAFDHGASAALSSLGQVRFPNAPPVWHVGDVKQALEALARLGRDRFSGDVIAVTGSVGKTTTKDMIHHMLGQFAAAQSTVENRAGPAEFLATLASVRAGVKYLTLETSSMAPGRIAFKGRIAKPNIAIVTNVGLSHAMSYAAPEDILAEKLALLDYAPDGVGIVHESILGMDGARSQLDRKPVSRLITVGYGPESDVRLCDVVLSPGAVEGIVSVFGQQHRFALPLPARHFAENMLFALATAHTLGLDIPVALHALESVSATDARMTRWRVQLRRGIVELIDDSCNAAPKSVEGLLQVLSERSGASRRVLVLGDMLELGPQEERLHDLLIPEIERAKLGLLVTVGPLAKRVSDRLSGRIETFNFEKSEDGLARVPRLLRHGDLVAVKGSHALRLSKLVEAIKAKALNASRAEAGWQIEQEPSGMRAWLATLRTIRQSSRAR